MANQADSVNEIDPDRAKDHIACVVLGVIVLAVIGVLNLPYDYVQAGERWIGISGDDQGISSVNSVNIAEMPRMAGWPLRYWIQYRRNGVMESRYWSGNHLVMNVAIGICLAAIVYGYMQFRNWSIGRGRNARLTRMLFDCGIALAILGVPTAVIAWENHQASEHWRLAARLAQRGNCQMACWLPSPVADQVPEGLLRTFSRLRQVTLADANQEMVSSVAETPTVIAVALDGGDFDASAIEPLVDNIHLLRLALTQRELSDSDVDIIARLPWLTELSLHRTNLDARTLRRLDHHDRLVRVDLTRTPLDLAGLGKPRWAATAEVLHLSRPLRGGATVSIDGWPRLRFLSIERFSIQMNHVELEIHLSNLPNLKELQLNRVQKHRLVVRNAPRLAAIDEGITELQESLPPDSFIPGLTWVSSLEIDGADSLTRLGCYARDLEHLSIRNVSSLRLFSLGSFQLSAFGEPRPDTVDPDRCREWIRFLGSWDGPSTIDLTGLPLSQVDLAPLSNNSRVRELILRDSGVSIGQVRQLKGLDKIERLDVRSIPLQQDELSWLLRRFPNLTQLDIDGTKLETFSISGNDKMRLIRVTELNHATDVRVVDVPRLNLGLRLSQVPRTLEIRNAPSLVGIAAEGSWPAIAEVSGLSKLEWFAAGGPAIRDDLLDVLLQCRKLDQLTLAYASISREKLKEIGDLSKLSLLALPGAEIDDEVTANWHHLKSLWEINLDDTSVSVGTVAWLGGIESLRRVSLNRVPLNEAAANALAQLRQVGELHLAETVINPEHLRPLFAEGNLDSLDLSGWPVDATLLEVLREAHSLRYLILHDTEIDSVSLKQLLAANRSLYIDTGVLHEHTDAQLAAELRRRADRAHRLLRVGWRQPMGLTERYERTEESPMELSLYQQAEGRIETRVFRPVVLADTVGN